MYVWICQSPLFRFDIYSLGKDARPDIEGIKSAAKKGESYGVARWTNSSVPAVHELLDFEIESTGVPPERIIVGENVQGYTDTGHWYAITFDKLNLG